MNLLLDTQVFLWSVGEANVLRPAARAAIEDDADEIFVSSAAVWEIAIKHALGKLTLPSDPSTYVPSKIAELGFIPLAFTNVHALSMSTLPPFHADPFDRMMIAQARCEGLTLATRDPRSLRYDVRKLEA